MKVKAVFALRSKRGLHRGSGAEPQVVGLVEFNAAELLSPFLNSLIPVCGELPGVRSFQGLVVEL